MSAILNYESEKEEDKDIKKDKRMDKKDIFLQRTKEIRAKVDKLYIYGAGLYARNIYVILKGKEVCIDGFIVTRTEEGKELFGLPVLNADSVIHGNVGIVIGANSLNRAGIMEKLEQSGFDMDYVTHGTDYIEKDSLRYDGSPTMQITTRIGCSVNCKYCPQALLVDRYFENDKNRQKVMSIDMFERCLNKLPENARVSFCGMVEPFLNPACGEMIKMAHRSGRIIELYTTLVGADRKTLEEIADIPFGYVTLHVADRYGYAHIPLTEEYYELVEFAVNYKRPDGTPFINMCNAQAQPDERIARICSGKYEVLTALHDRAGNLENEGLLTRRTPEGKISCSLCGTDFNHSNLLPDGSVLLCDFDYGLQHVLGNLLTQTYEEVMAGSVWEKIHKGAMGDLSEDILCRRCSCGNNIA